MALRNKFIKDEGFITYIPKYKLTRQFVIRNIPLDLSLAELKTVIEEENQDILISDLFRLKRRDRTTGIWSDSEAVCVQKLGEELPDHIKIYRTIVHTSPFQRCLQCGSKDHVSSKERPCSETKKCINCEEEHATSDRKCLKFMKNLEIAKVMAADNLPFMEARALVQKRENKNCPFYEDRRPPVFSSRNFPLLPSRGGVSASNFATSLQSSSRGRTFAASLMKVAPEISSKLLKIMEKASTIKQLDQLRFQELERQSTLFDCAAISETWLKPQFNFMLRGFDTVRRDRVIGRGGGVAILVSHALKYREISVLEDCAGDFNSHSPVWGSSFLCQSGRLLSSAIEDTELVLVSDGAPSFMGNASCGPSTIDLAFCHASIAPRLRCQTLNDAWRSDHYPVLITSSMNRGPSSFP
ncbi:uncharacterized protein LOC112459488, partial [Temnothorax curvispinosus]|uniref:Uncharacterized protein LOC112459488 n=1 Tax=Temnothorax curvispinosus TaxID=300111 RepID=A0A6J1QAM5_9HYME